MLSLFTPSFDISARLLKKKANTELSREKIQPANHAWKGIVSQVNWTGSMIRHSKSAFAIYQSSLGDLRAIFVLGL